MRRSPSCSAFRRERSSQTRAGARGAAKKLACAGNFAHEARHIDERRLRRCNVRNIYPCSAPIWTARWTRTRKRGCKAHLAQCAHCPRALEGMAGAADGARGCPAHARAAARGRDAAGACIRKKKAPGAALDPAGSGRGRSGGHADAGRERRPADARDKIGGAGREQKRRPRRNRSWSSAAMTTVPGL